MSEKLDHISPKAMDDCVDAAWDNLKTAIALRDKLDVPSEVLRVARALCQASNGDPDALVHYGMPQQPWRGSERWAVLSNKVSMAWTYFGYQARCAIANMEAHRQEEGDRLKQQEKSYDNETAKPAPDLKAVDIPVGFSGMNNGGGGGNSGDETMDVKFVAIDPSNPNRVTDSLSHADLAAMVDFLGTVFHVGPDGDDAKCRQTGEPFHTITYAWEHHKNQVTMSDQNIRNTLIVGATRKIIDIANPYDRSLYWRKRPEIARDGKFTRLYCRVAFGP